MAIDPRIQELMNAGMQFPSGVTVDMVNRVNSIPAGKEWDDFVAGVKAANNPTTPPALQYIAFQTRNGEE
jgi:hypothetical protein